MIYKPSNSELKVILQNKRLKINNKVYKFTNEAINKIKSLIK